MGRTRIIHKDGANRLAMKLTDEMKRQKRLTRTALDGPNAWQPKSELQST